MTKLKISIACVAVASLSGCAAFNTLRADRHTTTGQELLDLKKAHEERIITDEQYQEQIKVELEASRKLRP